MTNFAVFFYLSSAVPSHIMPPNKALYHLIASLIQLRCFLRILDYCVSRSGPQHQQFACLPGLIQGSTAAAAAGDLACIRASILEMINCASFIIIANKAGPLELITIQV